MVLMMILMKVMMIIVIRLLKDFLLHDYGDHGYHDYHEADKKAKLEFLFSNSKLLHFQQSVHCLLLFQLLTITREEKV